VSRILNKVRLDLQKYFTTNMYKSALWILLLLGTWSNMLQAQIVAPELICVKGDTLRWNLPVNTCGAMTSYNIYTANSPAGPFTLLDQVTDLNSMEYIRLNSPGGTLYYYMTASANCPGLSELHSDTLDNASPEPARITYASVLGTDIQLAWAASTSPETFAYIIFREEPNGTIVRLDTVMSLNYTDSGLQTDRDKYGYYVTAVDRCWVSSVFPDKHVTVVLRTAFDTCTYSTTLDFNAYQGYTATTYELWASQNGAPEQLVRVVNPPVSQINDLLPGNNFVLRIKSKDNNSANAAWSNQIMLNTHIAPRLESICITGLGVADSSINRLTFQTNSNVPPGKLKAVIEATYEAAENNLSGDNISTSGSSTTLSTISNGQFMKLISADNCGNVIPSNIVQAITLSGSLANARSIHLKWNTIRWENGVVQRYDVYYLHPDGTRELIKTVTDANTEADFSIPNGENLTAYCFQVTASIDLNCGQAQMDALAHSNAVCVEKTAGFFAPNAFKRSGITPQFKPVIYFPENLSSFDMYIFDRWGKEMFHTTDPAKGWSGRKDNVDAPVGNYIYLIRLQSGNGKSIEKKGSLILLD